MLYVVNLNNYSTVFKAYHQFLAIGFPLKKRQNRNKRLEKKNLQVLSSSA